MGVISRIRKMVSAKANDVLDGIEDPVSLAKEELRSLDADIKRSSESYFSLLGNKKLTEEKASRLTAQIQKRTEQLEKLRAQENADSALISDVERDIADNTANLAGLEKEIAELDSTAKSLFVQIEDAKRVRADASKRIQNMSAKQLSTKAMNSASNVGLQLNNNFNLGVFAQMEEKVGQEYATALAKAEVLGNGDLSLDERIEKAVQTTNG